MNAHSGTNLPAPLSAARFWEPRRLLYNLVLAVVVILWLVTNWSHFRPALTLSSLVALVILALLANLCYCAAYLADFAMQYLLPSALWTRRRWALWLLGTVFAVVLENYWIADEIYPFVNQGAPDLFHETNAMSTPHIASNMNFPAPLAVMGFLAACAGLFLTLVTAAAAWFILKPKIARLLLSLMGAAAVIYFGLLLGFSLASHAVTLPRGQEKYFCEIDCHLAYSVLDVKTQSAPAQTRYLITLRTRFDETTISPSRPKDAPLPPSPRDLRLIDDSGHEYSPASIQGTPLLTCLKPADSYTTQLEFDVPTQATGLKLLINTTPGWPDHLIIGDENSWLHKKTYLAL